MNSILATVTYQTSQSPRCLDAYRVSLGDSDLAPTGALRQTGPVTNGSVTYQGRFATRGEAAEAILAYVGFGKIVSIASPFGGERFALVAAAAWPRVSEYETTRVLASRTRRGVFVAA